MRLTRPLLAAGAAALVGAAALAEAPRTHLLRVALPDGRTQIVRYTGDVPPRVVLVADPFAAIDRMAAQMDAQMAAMLHGADAMQRAALTAAPTAMPAGTQMVSVSSVTVNGRTCTTRVSQVAGTAGQALRLFRQVAGDGCTGAAAAAPQGLVPAAMPKPALAKPATAPRDTI